MKTKIDLTSLSAAQFHAAAMQAAFEKADAANRKAHEELDAQVAALLPTQGLGYGALVEHVQSDANHGKPTDKVVVSRIVNAFTSQGRVVVRINLGVVGGGQGVHYANLPVSAITLVVETSEKKYGSQS